MKAALHYTIGRICTEVTQGSTEVKKENDDLGCDLERGRDDLVGVTFSSQVTAALTEMAYTHLTTYATDLEAYAR